MAMLGLAGSDRGSVLRHGTDDYKEDLPNVSPIRVDSQWGAGASRGCHLDTKRHHARLPRLGPIFSGLSFGLARGSKAEPYEPGCATVWRASSRPTHVQRKPFQ